MRAPVLACLLIAAGAAAEDSTLRHAGAEAHAQRAAAKPERGAGDDRADDDGGFVLWCGRLLFGSGDDDPRGWYRPLRRPYADGRGAFAWIAPLEIAPVAAAAPPRDPSRRSAAPAAVADALASDPALADRPELRASIARLDALGDGDRATPTRVAAAPGRDATARDGGVDVACRVGLDGARIENDLWRGGADARVLLPMRIEVDARAAWYHESLADSDANLWLSGVDVGWRALQFANLDARIGVGARWLRDDGGDEFGATLSAAIDVYPVRPLLIEGAIAAGTIGGTTLREARIGAGVVVDRAEIAIGWERIAIGTVPLDGPFIALRWWL